MNEEKKLSPKEREMFNLYCHSIAYKECVKKDCRVCVKDFRDLFDALAKERGYVKLDKFSGMLPRIPPEWVLQPDVLLEAYSQGRKDMLKVGFRKVKE